MKPFQLKAVVARTAALLVLPNAGDAVVAKPLTPGSTISLGFEHEPVGARLLAVTNMGFHTPDFDGRLISKVWADDSSNPWGGLTFSYKLAGLSACEGFPGEFSLGGFEGSLVDAGYFGSGRTPCVASRSEDGDQITWHFGNRRLHGASSAWLVIQTGCDAWDAISSVEFDDVGATVSAFAPVSAPEPTVPALTILALAAAGLCRRRAIQPPASLE